ncbi:bis(5'-adenosyl)-triphosphatase [Sporobolomyces salmoneus]|uniref:bis(5'-adenosyl)-triphosphatase n=1 Tax=Sporobolomyces salmoneus TaxID=183962 RepID=UPI00317FB6F6
MTSSLRFASFKIPNQIFYQSPLSLGIVNLKPLVPGHVLIIPKRVVPRFRDLTGEEVTDLFKSVHEVSRVIEKEFKAQALNIAMQDGPLAGQSVPHVHVHIIPRKAKDFEPLDEMYTALESKDLDAEFRQAYESRPSRSERKADEAARLERERTQFVIEQEAKRSGNVDVPFSGIEDSERRPRNGEEMAKEAKWLSEFFEPDNRGDFEGHGLNGERIE